MRLKRKAAEIVQVIQTNAGYYGDIGSIGDVNICVNNGNVQPFCQHSSGIFNIKKYSRQQTISKYISNKIYVFFSFLIFGFLLKDKNLCSHIWALCFMAQSLFQNHPMYADKCSQVCPHASIFQLTKLFDRSSVNAIRREDVPANIMIGMNIPIGYLQHFQ